MCFENCKIYDGLINEVSISKCTRNSKRTKMITKIIFGQFGFNFTQLSIDLKFILKSVFISCNVNSTSFSKDAASIWSITAALS